MVICIGKKTFEGVPVSDGIANIRGLDYATPPIVHSFCALGLSFNNFTNNLRFE